MPQFIGYHVPDGDRQRATPIAAGHDSEKTMDLAYARAVGAAVNGEVTVMQCDDMSPEEFSRLIAYLDKSFQKIDALKVPTCS